MSPVSPQASHFIVVGLQRVSWSGVGIIPFIVHSGIEAIRVPVEGAGADELREGVEFHICVFSGQDVGKPIADLQGNDVAFDGGHCGLDASDSGRFLIDSPAEVLELTWRQNGLAIRHVSTLVDNEDHGATIGVNNAAGLHNLKVANCMVVNAIKVSEATLGGDNTHVAANDGPIGSSINQGIKLVESATVNTNRVVSWIRHSGRRPLLWVILHPAGMLLRIIAGLWSC